MRDESFPQVIAANVGTKKCSGQMKPKSFDFYAKQNLFRKNHSTPVLTGKHGGGKFMLWGCFSSEGTEKLLIADRKMDVTPNKLHKM